MLGGSLDPNLLQPPRLKNLLYTKFKMKCFVKGEIFLTVGAAHSRDKRLYRAQPGKVVSDRNT